MNGMTAPWYGKPTRENIQRHLEEFKQREKEIDRTRSADYTWQVLSAREGKRAGGRESESRGLEQCQQPGCEKGREGAWHRSLEMRAGTGGVWRLTWTLVMLPGARGMC